MSEWQPIETAPQHGQVLLYLNGDMYVGVWTQNPYTGDEAFAVAELPDEKRAIVHPTHWMPLPEPPEGE